MARKARWMAAAAVGAVAAGASLWMLTPAAATGPVNPVEGGLGFLVLVEDGATLTNTESEGPLAVGGDLTFGAGYQIASERSVRVGAGDSPLVIGGRALIGAPEVVDAAVLKADDAGVVIRAADPPGAVGRKASLAAQDALDFEGVFATFRERSAQFATCTATVRLRSSGGGDLARPVNTPGTRAYLSLTPNQTNVLNLTGDEFNNLSDLTFNTQPSAATPLLINVDTGDSYEWRTANFAGISDNQAPFILMNFPNATAITQVGADTAEGTIYAPGAAFTDVNTANNEGNLVVRSYTHGTAATDGGETHDLPFNTTLQCGAAGSDEPVASRTASAAGPTTPVARPTKPVASKSPRPRPRPSATVVTRPVDEPGPLDSKFPWSWPSEPAFLPEPSDDAPIFAPPAGEPPVASGEEPVAGAGTPPAAGGEPAAGAGDPAVGDAAAGDPAVGDPG
ncbi:collagen-binding domain-containing protein, partial [Asanoa sp. NPDC050611]|uniref:choice-of-anchor A family protein n=1 Tax=Asanoa sp. NPDC050611 TaxID=3157098 RepID=UPI0033DFD555